MATWTHGTAERVTAADFVHDRDFAEICDAINRRRLLVYLAEDDFAGTSHFDKDTWISDDPVDDLAAPFVNLREQFTGKIIVPAVGGLGGSP